MPEGRGLKFLSSLVLAVCGALLLAGCNENLGGANGYRAYAPIPDDTIALMSKKGTDKSAPILIRAFKKEAELEVWKQAADGKYVYIKTFPMCRWSGQLGPKTHEGDRQVPEGFYTITPGSMNPNSAYYLSFNVGYPNAYDRAWGHTGGSIMVHGICSSAGCFSMTDQQIEEIYAITREAFAGGQRSVQMESFPFRMTAENLAKYRLDPNIAFWRELKRGSDYFETTKMQPPVGVCGKHYVFGTPKDGGRFDAESACPPLEENAEIRALLTQKASRDDAEVANLVTKGVKPVRTVYQDGGQNPVFANRFNDVSRPDALAAGPTDIALDIGPKAKPVAVQIAAAKAKPPVDKGLAPATTLVAASPKPADQTGTVVAAGTVPAAFGAAPTAYAKEEKSATAAFFDKVVSFDKVISFGHIGGDAAEPAKPADLAGAAPVAPAADKPQAQLRRKPRVTKPEAKPEPAKPDPATARLDPNFVALAPTAR